MRNDPVGLMRAAATGQPDCLPQRSQGGMQPAAIGQSDGTSGHRSGRGEPRDGTALHAPCCRRLWPHTSDTVDDNKGGCGGLLLYSTRLWALTVDTVDDNRSCCCGLSDMHEGKERKGRHRNELSLQKKKGRGQLKCH